MSVTVNAAIAALACPAVAMAAGFNFPDLGARQLGRGGTGVAAGGEVGALYYNPAALIGVEPWTLQVDAMASLTHVDFQRTNAQGVADGYGPVSNSGGVFPNTLTGLAWSTNDAPIPLAFALGVFGPSSTGNLTYPDPRAVAIPPSGSACDHGCAVDKFAPQRYGLISENLVVLYPTLAAAARVAPWLDLGLAFSLRVQSIQNTLAIYGGPAPGYGADFDATGVLKASELGFRVTGGVLVHPMDGLSFGVSGHLKEASNGAGTLDLALPPIAAAGHETIQGNAISLQFTYDPEVRAGVRYATGDVSVELDGVWEGWSSLDQQHIVTHDMYLVTPQGKTAIQPSVVTKGWTDAFSARAGLEWRPGQGAFIGRVGGLYETSAIPTATLGVDAPNYQRAGDSIGAEYVFGSGLSLIAAYERLQSPTAQIRDSRVQQSTSDAAVKPDIVGNGNLAAAIDYFSLGFGYAFGARAR